MQEKPSWKDLSPSQRDLLRSAGVVNGCGGKGGWIDPPDWKFTASCDHHDFNYWLGGSEADRLKADRGFYEAMLTDVKRLAWYRRGYGRLMAWAYYRAVRWMGGKFFSYRSKQRTWDDVRQYVPF